ncbi:LpxL/LpxP family Kdo(2)-lipid IV(A) lauroyl/palmitoleoyl acyltransferase [Thioflexithrix psekupsensis]|uniref:Lipid A biosynthesis acyltransferase n=1 Tax=Thioflexithrix psekupsensis TaxID=1570016 RepID=A0A251XAV2_9GAMM|nr:LpxL/LpxP family Kdo(2)-lipid IV(A) lauroyl/palmitoleoyl acyltransferase [Thioflexithrix psekupsensis]OUD15428.1 hypothetical protein TPSD3_02555 [Thioflexithrix psekupsensis]
MTIPAHLFAPRYWLLWFILGIFFILTYLPYHWQMAMGRFLGLLAYYLARRRRKIAAINIALCFPDDSPQQQQALLKRHFASLGMGLLEIFNAWWTSDNRLQSLGTIEGLDHLQQALAKGRGVILLSAHFTSLEIGARFLTLHTVIHGVYRAHENPLIEFFMKKSRELHAEKAIPRDNIREMVRSLKANKPVWFAVDQNFGHKGSVFAEFFGIQAATNAATARLAQLTGAAVVPFFTQRLPNDQGYRVILQAALTDFPSDNMQHDARRINALIEAQTKLAPEQYLWAHRRFKDRPNDEARFY